MRFFSVLQVLKIDSDNKEKLIDTIKSDIVRHVFAFYDVQHEPEKTTVYAAFDGDALKGYILIYSGLESPSIILECQQDSAEKLLGYALKNNFVMHTPPDILPTIQKRFPDAKHYSEDWMLVKKGDAKSFPSEAVRRLLTAKDAADFAALLSTRDDRPAISPEKCMSFIGKLPTFGVFVHGELVSYAGSFIQLSQVWMIGGVYTHPSHRNRGYATLATSAITEEALKNADSAALFVRSDNYPAVKVYESIGYRKIGEKLWVDVGTGLRP